MPNNDQISQGFSDFINSNPGRDEWLQRGIRGQNYGENPWLQSSRVAQTGLAGNLGGFGAQGLPLGLSTLNQILASQGAVDPRSKNRVLTSIGRGTEGQQQQQMGGAAGRGMQNSGVNQAINAAIGSAGADRAAGVEANFATQQEDRKRNDIMLMVQALMNPTLQSSNIAAGLQAQNVQGDAAKDQALAQFLGTIATAFCWVARAVYGVDDPRWLLARYYVLNMAPSWFRRLYKRHGQAVAGWLNRHPWAKPLVRPAFDMMVARASVELGSEEEQWA